MLRMLNLAEGGDGADENLVMPDEDFATTCAKARVWIGASILVNRLQSQ